MKERIWYWIINKMPSEILAELFISTMRALTLGEGTAQAVIWDSGAGGGWGEDSTLWIDHLRDGQSYRLPPKGIKYTTPETYKRGLIFLFSDREELIGDIARGMHWIYEGESED